MDEKKKIIVTILGGLALLFFVFTNFCRPLISNIATYAKEYKELKAEVKILDEISEDGLASMENKLGTVLSKLEEYLPSKGELRFVQHLTSSAEGLDVIFSDIAQRGSQPKGEYEELPVNILMKASFDDFLRYLLAVEQNPLFIGISSLNIRKTLLQSPILDFRITFVGFNLSLTLPPMMKYMEEKYKPIDTAQVDALSNPLPEIDIQEVFSRLGHKNIFVTAYDFRKPEPKDLDTAIAAPDSIADSFSLRGILDAEGKKAVLINGKIVREGEVVDGAQVVAIKDYKVIVRYLGRDYILKIGVDDAFTK
ncbi:MAG: type 4a pilus biogenesis protein PilO [Candidatus Omnitrophota bacterium]